MKYHLFLVLVCLMVAVVMFAHPETLPCARGALVLATVAAILAARNSRYLMQISVAFPAIGLMLIAYAPVPASIGHYGALQVFAGLGITFVAVLQAIRFGRSSS